jgi:hypothetical protein
MFQTQFELGPSEERRLNEWVEKLKNDHGVEKINDEEDFVYSFLVTSIAPIVEVYSKKYDEKIILTHPNEDW